MNAGSLTIKDKTINVEITSGINEAFAGLMGRGYLRKNQGMLFVVDEDEDAHEFGSISMGGVTFPLSIAYIDRDWTILKIFDMEPGDKDHRIEFTSVSNSTTKVDAACPVKYILETNQGWFDRHDIEIGSAFDIS